jgi:hypothetical protein
VSLQRSDRNEKQLQVVLVVMQWPLWHVLTCQFCFHTTYMMWVFLGPLWFILRSPPVITAAGHSSGAEQMISTAKVLLFGVFEGLGVQTQDG